MTSKEIHESLDKMLENPKSKNFLGHLVKNYFPTSNVTKVLSRPAGPFKCVITGVKLVSVEEILVGINSEEFKKDFFDSLQNALGENFNVASPMIKFLNGRQLAFTGKETTTYMSYNGLQEFYNWVIDKSLKNDKHINWLLGSVRRNIYGTIDVPAKPKVPKPTFATYSLGEVGAFKKIMENFKDEVKS